MENIIQNLLAFILPLSGIGSPPIYLVDYKMSFSLFKELGDKLAPHKDVVAVSFDKVLWELMSERQILCWFDELLGDMGIGLKLPNNRTVFLLSQS